MTIILWNPLVSFFELIFKTPFELLLTLMALYDFPVYILTLKLVFLINLPVYLFLAVILIFEDLLTFLVMLNLPASLYLTTDLTLPNPVFTDIFMVYLLFLMFRGILTVSLPFELVFSHLVV